ncbi:MAG: hypothetical protein ACE5DR_06120 [Thermodesulfobacteriota bacterium]
MVAIEAFLLKSQIGLAGEDMAYFRDPSQAVDSIKTMLISRNWKSLAGYYDLSRADNLDREAMISGDYFIRKERPEVAHPAGFWKYKHPFAPQFSYLSHRTFSEDIIEVTVYIEIDEGGGMTRRGMQSFHLQKSSKGYKLLPASDNRLPRAGAPDVPASGKFISEKKSVPEK